MRGKGKEAGCRRLRIVHMGKRQTMLNLRIRRTRREDCGSLKWLRLPFARGEDTNINIFVDLETGRILYPDAGKKVQGIESFEKHIEKNEKARSHCIVLITGFASAVQSPLPDTAIVFDHYHVTGLIDKAIDQPCPSFSAANVRT